MHIPRSPRAEGHIAAAIHHPKSSLRDPGSPNPHKDVKVRFAQTDQVKEFESGPAASSISSPRTGADSNSVPNGYYWPGGNHVNTEGVPQSASPSCAGATAPPRVSVAGHAQAQAQPQSYPAAPYGYYYNPYAYAQYAQQMGGQVWPSQQGPGQTGAPSAGPAQAAGNPAAGPLPPNLPPNDASGPHYDAKRMQMMARSVSITVNPAQQDGSSMQIPGGVVFGHGGVAASMGQPPRAHMPAGPGTSAETEEERETRLLKWVRSEH